MKRAISYSVAAAGLLVLAIVVAILGIYQSGVRNAHVSTGWYVLPESEYVRFKDRKQDVCARWLQGMPANKSFMELLENSPYTFDEWVDRGMKIDYLEETLLSFYVGDNTGISRDEILVALSYVGTSKSVERLIESYRHDDLSISQKTRIAVIVSNHGDESVVEPISGFVEAIEIGDSSLSEERNLKVNLVIALIPHAPKKAKEYLQQMQNDKNMREDEEVISYFLEMVDASLTRGQEKEK